MGGLAVIAPLAIPLIFGEQWLPSIILVQILSIVGLLRSTGNPVGALLLSKGRVDLGFKWNVILMFTQIPGLYLGAKLGGTIGVAIAFAILMCFYSIFNYLILIRTTLGPCLREYIASMWPSFWMSIVMAFAVFLSSELIKNMSAWILLVIQVLTGMIVYFSLIMFCQKNLIYEIKNMLLKKEVCVVHK